MKLLEHFDTFMAEAVNLNTTRVTQLEDNIEALKGAMRGSDWKPKIRSFVPQGSWAHKTIIKPVEGRAFDADLLVHVNPVEGWGAKDYLSTLRDVFAKHSTYKDKVRRYSHCITIEYAGERKVDLVPCVVDRGGRTGFEVCNYNSNEFEQSEPERYTDWLVARNAWTTGNGLRKVTRLLKYLRDIKGTFSCSSVLMTTLLGDRIAWLDAYNTTDFADLPTALKTIVGRLDTWLQARPSLPVVNNPVLTTEVFSTFWDQARYANFRDLINKYRTWIDEAYDEKDRDESIGKWRRVFGDDFAKGVVLEKAAHVSDAAMILAERTALTAPGFVGDLVTLFTRFGRRALPAEFDRLPHKQRPRWRELSTPLFSIGVVATRHAGENGPQVADVPPGSGPLSKGQWLRFRVRAGGGILDNNEFEIHWRVTNTDREATVAGCLRGGFERADRQSSRWEHLGYRGVHSVEAFVVRKRDQVLAARSEPFYVVVG